MTKKTGKCQNARGFCRTHFRPMHRAALECDKKAKENGAPTEAEHIKPDDGIVKTDEYARIEALLSKYAEPIEKAPRRIHGRNYCDACDTLYEGDKSLHKCRGAKHVRKSDCELVGLFCQKHYANVTKGADWCQKAPRE